MADKDLAQFGSNIGLNPPGGYVGADLASSATITLTHPLHHVTGTAEVTTITPPVTGMFGSITLIADGAFTMATGGTAPNAVSTAVVMVSGQAVDMVHDGNKWFPKIAD